MDHRLSVRNRGAHPRLRYAALALGVVAVLGACSSAEEAAPDASKPAASSTAGSITIAMFIYKPSPATVKVGDTVTWTNTDQILHTATSGAPGSPTGVFDLEMDGPGKSGKHTFTEAGTFTYFCDRHNSMRGELTVEG